MCPFCEGWYPYNCRHKKQPMTLPPCELRARKRAEADIIIAAALLIAVAILMVIIR